MADIAVGDAGGPIAADATDTRAFDIGIHEPLPLGQALVLGFQHIFGMIGMFVFPGIMGQALHLSFDSDRASLRHDVPGLRALSPPVRRSSS